MDLLHQLARALIEPVRRILTTTPVVVLPIESQLRSLNIGTDGRHVRSASPEEIPLVLHLHRRQMRSSVLVTLLAVERLYTTVVACGQFHHHLATDGQRVALQTCHKTIILFVVFHNTPKLNVKQNGSETAEDVKERNGYNTPTKAFDSLPDKVCYLFFGKTRHVLGAYDGANIQQKTERTKLFSPWAIWRASDTPLKRDTEAKAKVVDAVQTVGQQIALIG